MKITNYAIAFMSAAAIFAGCAKQEIERVDSESPVFVASIDDESKTTINDTRNVLWVSGDEVSINDRTYTATPDEKNPIRATLKNDGTKAPSKVDNKYYAFYPTGIITVTGSSTKKITMTLPDEYGPTAQTVKVGNVCPMYATCTATSGVNDLKFKNICGLLQINLINNTDKAINFSKIQVSAAERKNLSGTFTIKNDTAVLDTPTASRGNGTMVAYDVKPNSSTLGVDVPAKSTGTYYIPVPAGTYKLTFDVRHKTSTGGGGSTSFKTVTAKNSTTIERNKIYPVNITL